MAAPTIRGQTAAVAGLTTTSPAGTQVGDLVIVYTFERLGAGSGSTLTKHSSMDAEIDNFFHNDGSTDGALAVAYKVATSSGAVSYQGFTSSTGAPSAWTGCSVLTAGTFYAAGFKTSGGSTQTNNAVPNPPQVTGLDTAHAYLVFALSAWHLGSSATVTPTVVSTYSNMTHISGSALAELAICSKALAAGASSEDPGTYGDDVAPNGTCSITFAIPDGDRRGQVSFAELEVPNAPRRGQVSFAELEVPDAPRRARVSFAELETLSAPAAWPNAELADDFNRADGGLGSKWSTLAGFTSAGISTNRWIATSASIERWLGNGATADFEVYATIVALPSEGSSLTIGGALGADETTRIYLRCTRVAGSNNDQLLVQSGNSWLGDTPYEMGRDWTVGDQVGIRVIGTALEAWVKPNGGSWNRRVVLTLAGAPSAGDFFLGSGDVGGWDDFNVYPPPSRRGQVSFAEFEVPDAPGGTDRRGQVSFAELEVPDAPRRAQVSFAELEVPTAPRRGQISFAELEVPDAPRRAQVSFAELEVADAPRRAQVSFAELEVPTAPRRAQVSFAEFEAPDAPRRAQVSFAELEVPEVGAPAAADYAIYHYYSD